MDRPPTPLAAPAPTPYRPLLWVAAAAGAGVVVDSLLETQRGGPLFGAWWLAGAGLLFAAVISHDARPAPTASILVLLSAACLGGAWHHWRWNFAAPDDLARFARETPQPACIEAVLVDRVKISPPADSSPLRVMPAQTTSEATIRVERVRDGADWRPASGNVRLRVVGAWREAAQGDRLLLFAQLGKPQPPMNPGEFDWAAHERRAGRLTELFCVRPECIAIQERAGRFRPSAWVAAARAWCESRLSRSVAPATAPMVLATLMGDQERIPDATKEAFLQTGSIHLLVVSGMHVALLAAMAWGLARLAGFSSRAQFATTVAALCLYAAIVGPQPSVIRATILALATVLALAHGRAASAGNLLGAAALVVMAYNPCEVFRAGTQLSFLSVGVLIGYSHASRRARPFDPLARLIADHRPFFSRLWRRCASALAAMTIASLVVGVAIAPLVAFHFHIITPASIALTPLAGPLIAVALYAGAALVSGGWLLPPVAALLGAICGQSLELAERIVLAARDVPGAYFYSAGFSAPWLCLGYGAAGIMAAVPRWRPSTRWQLALVALWFTIGYAELAVPRTFREEFRCTFLSMGHGTCVVMELPSGKTILYDAGSLGSPTAASRTIASYLWDRGIDQIDALVLSHADVDHYNAVPGLVERFPVGVVYVSPMMFDPIATDGELSAPNYLRDFLAEHGVPLQQLWMNDRLRTGDDQVAIRVLHPPREGVPGRDNANSLLLAVDYAGRRILLPGDLESPGIERVMADPPVDCDILLAPHHGSTRSDPPGFAAWCTPEYVVVSGERPERTTAAQRSYEAAGARITHTAVAGAIAFTLDSETMPATIRYGDR